MDSNLQDTPLVVFLRLLGDLLAVNLLAIFCSIPVVTVGASLSAMYAVLFRRERQDGSVETLRTFFDYFLRNLIQASLFGLVVLAVAVVALVDFRFAVNSEPPIRSIYIVLCIVIASVGLILFIIGFAQQSIYKNTIRGYVKNSFLLAFCAPGRLLLSAAAWILPWVLLVWMPEVFLVKFGFLYLMWAFSFPAWATVKAFNSVFQKTEEQNKGSSE